MVLDRPHPRHLQVLEWGARVSVPGIVRDVDQHLGAVGGEQPHFIRKDRFITDEYTGSCPAQVEYFSLGAAGEFSYLAHQLARKKQKPPHGHVFAERNKVDLVVTTHVVSGGVYDQSRVV